MVKRVDFEDDYLGRFNLSLDKDRYQRSEPFGNGYVRIELMKSLVDCGEDLTFARQAIAGLNQLTGQAKDHAAAKILQTVGLKNSLEAHITGTKDINNALTLDSIHFLAPGMIELIFDANQLNQDEFLLVRQVEGRFTEVRFKF